MAQDDCGEECKNVERGILKGWVACVAQEQNAGSDDLAFSKAVIARE